MILNPLLRVVLLIAGIAFVAFGIRDSSDGLATLAVGVGLGVMILPFTLVSPLRSGQVDARRGSRALDGADRHGTLLVPFRRFVAALGVAIFGLAVCLGGLAVRLRQDGEVPLAVAVVIAVVAALLLLAGLVTLRGLRGRESFAIVLAPDGLGPLGVRAQWVVWEDVRRIRLRTSVYGNLLSPGVEITTTEQGTHQLTAARAPMAVRDLLTTLQRLHADPQARQRLTTADPALLAELRRPG